MATGSLISAADVEKFGYCPLSWWLSRGLAEETGPEIFSGAGKHERVSEDLKGVEVHETRAKESETTVLYFAIAATIVSVLGLSFATTVGVPVAQIFLVVSLIWLLAGVYFLYKAETLVTPADRLIAERVMLVFSMVAAVIAVAAVSTVFVADRLLGEVVEAVALVWLIGASYFLYHSLSDLGFARVMREKHGVGAAKIDYIDSEQEKPKLFVSEKYGLSGRPDYVVVSGDHHVPVEVKTGRIPRGPLFSHILQVAAYCLLIEEEYGTAPPYGIIRYYNGDTTVSHEIEYNPDTRQLIIRKLAEMRQAIAKGEAHRNHSRPGKCVHCSRRTVCPERLA